MFMFGAIILLNDDNGWLVAAALISASMTVPLRSGRVNQWRHGAAGSDNSEWRRAERCISGRGDNSKNSLLCMMIDWLSHIIALAFDLDVIWNPFIREITQFMTPPSSHCGPATCSASDRHWPCICWQPAQACS